MMNSNIESGFILIVDDSTTNLAILSDMLQGANFRFRVAMDGQTTLDLVKRHLPQLILLDVMLPDLDGFTICQHLKSDVKTESIPIILITGLTDTEDKIRGFEVGAVDYLTKPFQQEELLARINLHLRLRYLNQQLEQKVAERTAELVQTNQQLSYEITERKKVELELRSFSAQLKQSNQELEAFAYIASHDLQEPLRKIQTFGDRLKHKYGHQLDTQGQNYLARMLNAAERSQQLIRDLLALSHITTQSRPFTPVNLHRLVAEVLSDLEVMAEEGGATVHCQDLPTLEADPSQMRQLFQNLISNALKFRQLKIPAKIEIQGSFVSPLPPSTTPDPAIPPDPPYPYHQIVVADNGIGFETKYLDRIFNPFQRLHSQRDYQGTGVGLAICRKIVEHHGGQITATSVVGQGSRFIIQLPIPPNLT
jgi:signal transduction histidine kinase